MRGGSSKDKRKNTPSPEPAPGPSTQEEMRLKVSQSMEDTCAGHQCMIIKLLGKGSYGEVYLCQRTDNGVNSKVALKVIDTEKANKIYVDKFLKRECEILMDVKFHFIIRLYCLLHRRNKFYFFMRYAEQGDLLDFIAKEGRQEEQRARLWGGQLAAALDFLHKNNIAHRDIKCENILLTRHMNTMLTDFGFSTKYDVVNGKPDLCTTYCGTKHYASPEILTYTPYDPEKADVWAFGVVLYVVLNGMVPFRGTVTKKILECQQKGISRIKNAVTPSEDVMDIFENVFDINPAKRWTAKRLVSASWFKPGPTGRRTSYTPGGHGPDFQKIGKSSKNASLLMAGEHQFLFWKEPMSFVSGIDLMPSFMARSQESQGLKERLAEYKKRRGKRR